MNHTSRRLSLPEFQELALVFAKHASTARETCLARATGLAIEAGELLELYHKDRYCEQPLIAEKVMEELGDVLWYAVALADEQNLDLNLVLQSCIAKLYHRHYDTLSQERRERLARYFTYYPDNAWPHYDLTSYPDNTAIDLVRQGKVSGGSVTLSPSVAARLIEALFKVECAEDPTVSGEYVSSEPTPTQQAAEPDEDPGDARNLARHVLPRRKALVNDCQSMKGGYSVTAPVNRIRLATERVAALYEENVADGGRDLNLSNTEFSEGVLSYLIEAEKLAKLMESEAKRLRKSINKVSEKHDL